MSDLRGIFLTTLIGSDENLEEALASIRVFWCVFQFLHSAGITHGELTPAHVGVTQCLLVKLFGFDSINARRIRPAMQTKSAIYVPPEYFVQILEDIKPEKGNSKLEYRECFTYLACSS